MSAQYQERAKVDLPEYLPITIHAVCANCGVETDNAEKDFRTFDHDKMYCVDCMGRMRRLMREENGLALAQIVGDAVTCVDEQGYDAVGKLVLLRNGNLAVRHVHGDNSHRRLEFPPWILMGLDYRGTDRVKFHVLNFWTNAVNMHTTFYG